MELTGLLERLKLDYLEAQLDAICEQGASQQLDYKNFLIQALDVEWQGRSRRGTEARLRLARFPWLKTLEQFDFDFQPSLDRRQVRELVGPDALGENSSHQIFVGLIGSSEVSQIA